MSVPVIISMLNHRWVQQINTCSAGEAQIFNFWTLHVVSWYCCCLSSYVVQKYSALWWYSIGVSPITCRFKSEEHIIVVHTQCSKIKIKWMNFFEVIISVLNTTWTKKIPHCEMVNIVVLKHQTWLWPTPPPIL